MSTPKDTAAPSPAKKPEAAVSKDSLTITDNRNGKTYEVPIQDGTIKATDLRQIKVSADDFGLMTYDPGFMNTASCKSRITFIDGDKGILNYRGYPIEELAEQSNYLETAYLLLNGELPTKAQYDGWVEKVTTHTFVHENVKELAAGFRYDAHPMGMLASTVAALSTFYPDAKRVHDAQERARHVYRLIAKIPTLAAFAYRHSMGLPYIYPDNELSYPANFLQMMFKTSELKYKVHPALEKALTDPEPFVQALAADYSKFVIKRGYISVDANINSFMSARITPDITQDSTGDIKVRLKYAYAKFQKPSLGYITKPFVEVGVVHMPWLDYEEHINLYRMQDTMFMERNGLFNSADLGVMFGGNFGPQLPEDYRKAVNDHYAGRWGSFAVGVYNGGGYHASEKNEDKALEGRFTLRPLPDHLPGLQVSVFGVSGKGNIADAIRAAGATPDVVEPSGTLRTILEAKGYTLSGHDFMDILPMPVYDAILMNPPFEGGQDIDPGN